MALGFVHSSFLPSSTINAVAFSSLLARLNLRILRGCRPATRRFGAFNNVAVPLNSHRHRRGHAYDGRSECCRQLHNARRVRTDAAEVLSASGAARGIESAIVLEEERDGEGGDAAMVPPPHISPSSISTFRQCRQLFYYKHILRLKVPSTREQVRGIVVHDVLSRYFDLPQESRNIAHLHEVFREVMGDLIASEKEDPRHGYANFFEGREEEQKWAVECLDLIANFLVAEQQNPPMERDPEQRELKMSFTFGDAADDQSMHPGSAGGNSRAVADRPSEDTQEATGPSGVSITGIIDRLDRCADGKLRVVDYKTGKAPEMKYSEATNHRIMNEKFFQLQIYALLVERVLGEIPGEMRIVYLNGPVSVTRALDPRALPVVEQELRAVWDEILLAVADGHFPPEPGRLCDWCNFKDRCPAFTGKQASRL